MAQVIDQAGQKSALIQDSLGTPGGQFWKRLSIIEYYGRKFRFDINLEASRIGQGHAICSVWTESGWVEVSRLAGGEEVATSKTASTYSKEVGDLVDWSDSIVDFLFEISTRIVSFE